MKKIYLFLMLCPFYLHGQISLDKMEKNDNEDITIFVKNTDTIRYFVSLELQMKCDSIWLPFDKNVLAPTISKETTWMLLEPDEVKEISFNLHSIFKKVAVSLPHAIDASLSTAQEHRTFRLKVISTQDFYKQFQETFSAIIQQD